MQTLDEHNEGVRQREEFFRNNRPAGVACSKCGNELRLTNNLILTTDPPKQRVHCTNCGFSGYKLG